MTASVSHVSATGRRESSEQTTDVSAAEPDTRARIAMIGHEIRSPISALQNGITLLGAASLDSEKLTQISEMMQRQLAQVVRLLDDLNDGVCLSSRKLRIENAPVDLTRVGLHALDTIDRLVTERRQELSVALPPLNTVWVRGDHVRLIEVVVNLLTNAAKYTGSGGHIQLRLKADQKTATLTVRDSGMGISKHAITRIFDGPSRRVRSLHGMKLGQGLGLPMVHNFVQLHGGEVSAYSAGEGQGSEFTVRLPRLIAD